MANTKRRAALDATMEKQTPATKEIVNSIKHQLQVWMAAEDLSQKELERRTGITQSNISRMVLGLSVTRLETLTTIVGAMGGEVEVRFVHKK